jgi:hypothetical protein
MPYLRPIVKYASAVLSFAMGVVAWGSPTLTVASPRAGAVGAPTYFDATASTSTCAFGISAVRIYSEPGVVAFTTNSPHLETFLNLKPASYNIIIQAWDQCGGVANFPSQSP